MVSTVGRLLPLVALLAPLAAAAASVSGRVVNIQTQQILAGATVSTGDGSTAGVADQAGFFRLASMEPGARLLRVRTTDGAEFSARVVVPAQGGAFFELDQARHSAPEEDEEY